jgi:hypothetical protein
MTSVKQACVEFDKTEKIDFLVNNVSFHQLLLAPGSVIW